MINRETKVAPETSWTETLLTSEKKALVDILFPFRIPPLNVACDTLLVEDPALQLHEGFHQTRSSIFLFPRDDERLLIPVVAFNESYPSLSLWVLISETMPRTYEGNNRRWAVWLGKAILENLRKAKYQDRNNIMAGYTPERAARFLDRAEEVKEIYSVALRGAEIERGRLYGLMEYFVAGSWSQYYSQELPQIIAEDREAGAVIVGELFDGLEVNLAKAGYVYKGLPADSRLLLDDSFPLIIKAKLNPPFLYFSDRIKAIRSGELDETSKLSTRDPLEIVGRTQGISHDEVEKLYLPDEVFGTAVGNVVQDRIRQMELLDKVKKYSDLEAEGCQVYESCSARYQSFNSGALVKLIREEKLAPLLPSEWQLDN